jgi:hypothetical protein
VTPVAAEMPWAVPPPALVSAVTLLTAALTMPAPGIMPTSWLPAFTAVCSVFFSTLPNSFFGV